MAQNIIYIIIFISFFSFIAFIIGIILLLKYLRQRKLKKIAGIHSPDPHTYTLVSANSSLALPDADTPYTEYALDIKKQLMNVGKKLFQSNITDIYFIHGTFVGDDPFEFFNSLYHYFNFLDNGEMKKNLQGIKQQLKKKMDTPYGDNGNFTNKYVGLAQTALGNNIKTHNFTWSSNNHHFARIEAAYNLIKFIIKNNSDPTLDQKKILLIGHSHGGQLMALITLFLNDKKFKKKISEHFFKNNKDAIQNFNLELKKISKLHIYNVTMGTPIRYNWALSSKHKLLNIVNHRGDAAIAGEFSGVLTTKDGDYIQSLGIAGSDFKSPINDINQINLELDDVLDKGSDITLLRQNLLHKQRVADFGHTLLVNYFDQSKTLPNFTKTVFGHGVYTTTQKMLLNFDLIVKYLLE